MNMTIKALRAPLKPQSGFGLVELMVAVTLGFVVVAAVGYLYLGSRQSFRTNDNMARIQENARYALDTMARDIRMAGFIGCANLAEVTPTAVGAAPAMTTATAITGSDGAGGLDTIQIMAAVGGGVVLAAAHPSTTADVTIQSNSYDFKIGDILALTGCNSVDLVEVTGVAGAGPTTITHAGARAGNYAATDIVMKVENYGYSVADGGLQRTSLNEGTVELVDGVGGMQIVYGVDTTAVADGVADIYQSAAAVADWSRVVSARISLLMVGPENNVVTSPQTYYFDTDDDGAPNAVAAADRRLYQVFTTTIGVRNRLP